MKFFLALLISWAGLLPSMALAQSQCSAMFERAETSSRVDFKKLVDSFPENVKVIDRVKFTVGKNGPSGLKPLIIISLKNLSDEQKEDLLKKYIDILGSNTLTFPRPLHDGLYHLMFRKDKDTVDLFAGPYLFNWVIRRRPAQLPKSDLIEPIALLSPETSQKLDVYIQNAQEKTMKTVGIGGVVFGIDRKTMRVRGVVSGKTVGRLDNNRPLNACEWHNCTTWINTAPVGPQGAGLFTFFGESDYRDSFASSRSWSNYLLTETSESDVPAVVYWTQDSVQALLQTLETDSKFISKNLRLEPLTYETVAMNPAYAGEDKGKDIWIPKAKRLWHFETQYLRTDFERAP